MLSGDTAASFRYLVAHPTVEQHAQRGDESKRLVEHNVVSRLGHLDDGRSRSHQGRHVGRRFARNERALFTKYERGATTHRLQILADRLAEASRAHGLAVELPNPAVLGPPQRMATDEFDNERIIARLFGHQAKARQRGLESLIDTLVLHRWPCERIGESTMTAPPSASLYWAATFIVMKPPKLCPITKGRSPSWAAAITARISSARSSEL